ncbi:unnamed protein product [Fusarium graminearum]|uniref:Chromosome 1, complete genome n=1 Tax=Gibberella zeae (strain ATCC MYA-4620 / CBS 123657 / FGSC 9075 / NRRL 31084 / PH-1) TaxID=229533 RepID=A0A098DA61_GIBZE|nr:unnamed protein product [Fusarium graminearum]CZS78601.1 unnamed protein product [Fusarium graminearum]
MGHLETPTSFELGFVKDKRGSSPSPVAPIDSDTMPFSNSASARGAANDIPMSQPQLVE